LISRGGLWKQSPLRDIDPMEVTMIQQQTIKVRTRSGKLIERKAAVADLEDSMGTKYKVAQIGIWTYRIKERDSEGNPVWAVSR